MQYMSVRDAAQRFGISERRIQKLCEQGRIPGSRMISSVWIIPDNAEKPEDARFALTPPESNLLSLKGLSSLLSISEATARNWQRLGKITPSDYFRGRPVFTRDYAETLKKKLVSGENTALRSRRNKKYVSGSSLYRDYVSESPKNAEAIGQVLSCLAEHGIVPDENVLRLIAAECALQLFAQRYGIPSDKRSALLRDFLCGRLSVQPYDGLVSDLTGDPDSAALFVKEHEGLFSAEFTYEEYSDIIGWIYISCRSMSERKATGTYYTPETTVRALMEDAFGKEMQAAGKRILDPCCGTGNFLLQLPPEIPPENVHGSDIDETSVLIARINLALKFRGCDAAILRRNITVRDSMEDDGRECFDLVIGNPPWGFDYPESEKEHLRERFRTARGKCVESYDLFIEQSFRKLSTGGRLAFVLPEAALSVRAHRPVREEIMRSGRIAAVRYLGNVFDRVQCPCVILTAIKDPESFTSRGMRISTSERSFSIETERKVSAECFSFTVTDDE